jgi:DNA invertase Pin-like site-specific DNA recombinase
LAALHGALLYLREGGALVV